MDTIDFSRAERTEAPSSNLYQSLTEQQQPAERTNATFARMSSSRVQELGFPSLQLTDSNPKSFLQASASDSFQSRSSENFQNTMSPYGQSRTSRPTDSQSRQPGEGEGPRTSGPTGRNIPWEANNPPAAQREPRVLQREAPPTRQEFPPTRQELPPRLGESPYGRGRTSERTGPQTRHEGENPGDPRTSRPTGRNSPFEQRQQDATKDIRVQPHRPETQRPEPRQRPETQRPAERSEKPQPQPPEKPGQGEREISVKPGETLWGIAKKNLQLNGETPSPREILKMVDEIAKRNGIKDSNKIHPDQKIIIPKHKH